MYDSLEDEAGAKRCWDKACLALCGNNMVDLPPGEVAKVLQLTARRALRISLRIACIRFNLTRAFLGVQRSQTGFLRWQTHSFIAGKTKCLIWFTLSFSSIARVGYQLLKSLISAESFLSLVPIVQESKTLLSSTHRCPCPESQLSTCRFTESSSVKILLYPESNLTNDSPKYLEWNSA